MRAHVVALKSIANALEDLEDVDALDQEVDRTMLIDSIRADIARLEQMLSSETSNPALPLVHLSDALTALLGEDFDAEGEAALRERIAAFPGFLAALREDARPAPPLILDAARAEADAFDAGPLDMAAERLDDATVQPALVAIAEHRAWLARPEHERCSRYGFGEERLEAQHRIARRSEPLGAKGTLRLLELRRAGVERSLSSAVEELGMSDPISCAQQLMEEAQPSPDVYFDFWQDEWTRVGTARCANSVSRLPDADAPDRAGGTSRTGWSMLRRYAVRDHAERMMQVAKVANPRAVRRLLRGPGLLDGWGRTVAAFAAQY